MDWFIAGLQFDGACTFLEELDTASDIASEFHSQVGSPFLSPAEELAFSSIIQQMMGEGEGWWVVCSSPRLEFRACVDIAPSNVAKILF